ncbi:MAG TPA: class II aldolase/adducin family protein, partial [Thermoanaerobaculia bacterium]|nr:class II aldolase/adducin family protein [Thermoanaerobaculia bacterium]
SHSPFSLAFACRGATIQPYTLHSKILGDIPCLQSDADLFPERNVRLLDEMEEQITSGVCGYRYAYRHFEALVDELEHRVVPRGEELIRHGLAFTVYKHGIFVVARNLAEAFDNLIRVERNAQVQLLGNLIDAQAIS